MLRHEWKFNYEPEVIVDAIKARIREHEERIRHLEDEHVKAESAIKERGFETERRDYTGGYNVEAKIDPTLLKRLNQCEQKLDYHRKQLREFRNWLNALRSRVEPLQLDIGDVEYFGLGEGTI